MPTKAKGSRTKRAKSKIDEFEAQTLSARLAQAEAKAIIAEAEAELDALPQMEDRKDVALGQFVADVQRSISKDEAFAKAMKHLAGIWRAHYLIAGHRNQGRALWDEVLKTM